MSVVWFSFREEKNSQYFNGKNLFNQLRVIGFYLHEFTMTQEA